MLNYTILKTTKKLIFCSCLFQINWIFRKTWKCFALFTYLKCLGMEIIFETLFYSMSEFLFSGWLCPSGRSRGSARRGGWVLTRSPFSFCLNQVANLASLTRVQTKPVSLVLSCARNYFVFISVRFSLRKKYICYHCWSCLLLFYFVNNNYNCTLVLPYGKNCICVLNSMYLCQRKHGDVCDRNDYYISATI